MSDWETLKLDELARIERGRFSPRPRNDPKYYGGDIPFVQTGNVSRASIYIREYSQTLNEKGLAVSKLFPKSTILMTIAANIGDVAILNFDSACPDSLVAFTPKNNVDRKWFFHVLTTMKSKFDRMSTWNHAQKNLELLESYRKTYKNPSTSTFSNKKPSPLYWKHGTRRLRKLKH